MIQSLNEKDEHIINSIPTECKSVADVGAGDCVLSYYIAKKGFNVTAFDIYENKKLKEYPKNIFKFELKSLFDIMNEFDIVICSQVLEHIKEWQNALFKLLKIFKNKLIITIPWKKSFLDPGHINFWDDDKHGYFENINIFKELSKPYKVVINRIYTKLADRKTGQMDYMIEAFK
jgi:ubiquinone/menaquinone biosynthesis C-methylase UbiE